MPRRIECACCVLLAIGTILSRSLGASEPLSGEIRFLAGIDGPAWVGQKVELHLELWTDGFTFGDQLFVLPEVPGGFLLQGDANTVKLSENRQGRAWQGLRYTFFLYPQSAGRLLVDPFDVSYTVRAGFGSEPTAFSFQTEPLSVEARWPPGVEPGGVLVTTEAFSLEAEWDRPLPAEGPLQLQTGEALTLEVRREAAGVPGMVFDPPGFPEIDGLGIYLDNPRVEDRTNRGELTGKRIDRITFVCETAGTYAIPEWRFQWWDPSRTELLERTIPAIGLEVAVNPAWQPIDDDGVAFGVRTVAYLALIGFLAALVGLAWRRVGRALLPGLLQRWRGRTTAGRLPGRRNGSLLPLNPRGRG